MSWLNKLKLFILLLISTPIKSKILFEDNFNELNETKWEIITSETKCKSELTLVYKYENSIILLIKELMADQLSCATNSTKNLRIISGALVLTAINETFGDQLFTSSIIITRESFNLSSSNLTYEVRSTLPTDEGVFGVIVLIPE